jgi:hypothetical protein
MSLLELVEYIVKFDVKVENLEKSDTVHKRSGAKPTIVSYNARVVKIYNATNTHSAFGE